LLTHGRWFSPGTPASSTTKTGPHDIAEILLNVPLNTKINQSNQSIDGDSYLFIDINDTNLCIVTKIVGKVEIIQ
jgi:hypothetical protein